MYAQTQQRSLGELVSELVEHTQGLVRDEIRLSKLEMTEKAKLAAKDAVMVGAGVGVAAVGALVLLAAVVLIFALFMPLWLAALILGVVATAAGVAIAMSGLAALKKIDPAPRQTIQTLREDKAWLRAELAR